MDDQAGISTIYAIHARSAVRWPLALCYYYSVLSVLEWHFFLQDMEGGGLVE